MFTIQFTLFSISFVMLIMGLGRFSKSIFRWHPVDLLFHFKKYELTTRVKKIIEEHVKAFDRVFHETLRTSGRKLSISQTAVIMR